jgi:hypothetical protein
MRWEYNPELHEHYCGDFTPYELFVFEVKDKFQYVVYFDGFIQAMGYCDTLEKAKEFGKMMVV